MPDTQNCRTHKIAFKIIKNAKATKFLSQSPSTLPQDAFANFYLSVTFGLSFMISSVAPTRSSTSYAYLITRIENCNLKSTVLFHLSMANNVIVFRCSSVIYPPSNAVTFALPKLFVQVFKRES